MLTAQQKRDISALVAAQKAILGTWKKVGNALGANEATVMYVATKPDYWTSVSNAMWLKLANALNYKITTTDWQLARITNTEIVARALIDAQSQALFCAISHPAGQGKTAGALAYRAEHEGVFYIECEESWSHKRFVQKLAELCGVKTDRLTVADLTAEVVAFFRRKTVDYTPLLVIDEANKLKPSSLRLIIPLYNQLQDEIGLVLMGAHDLRDHIKRGVGRDVRGYDELESRLGRSYIPLHGVVETDVRAICAANGLTDGAAQARIWQKMEPVQRFQNGVKFQFATADLRRLKMLVKRERQMMMAATEAAKQTTAAPTTYAPQIALAL